MKRFVSPPRILLCAAVVGVTLLQGVTACAQQSAVWRDPSPHNPRFVTVDKDVQLEVLDWGGSGHPIVLLSGGVLAIYAVPVDSGPWLTSNEDPEIRAAVEAFLSRSTQSTLKQAKSFEDGVPGARVVRLPHAMHLVFLSNEADVLREMRSFLETLN